MIPVESYHNIFLFLTVGSSVLLALYTLIYPNMNQSNHKEIPYALGVFLFVILTLFISTRPISYYFGDMGNYYAMFQSYYYSSGIKEGDVLFESIMYFFAKNLNAELFFFFCGILYFFPLYFAYKRIFKSYWPVAFILSTISISFYGFAVNGIRNGIAAHIFLLALTIPRRYSWIIIMIAIGFHSSMLIVTIPYIAIIFFARVKVYYYFWLVCLVSSFFYSGFGDIIQALGLSSDRLDAYIDAGDSYSDQFSKTGYRYDFVIYGALPVVVSYYYIYKRGFKDYFYNNLVCIYLFANALFVLINYVAFSNRFAYLSWFMMTVILLYPIYKLRTKHDGNVFILLCMLLISTNLFVNG